MNRQRNSNIFVVVCVFDFGLNILFRVSKAWQIASFSFCCNIMMDGSSWLLLIARFGIRTFAFYVSRQRVSRCKLWRSWTSTFCVLFEMLKIGTGFIFSCLCYLPLEFCHQLSFHFLVPSDKYTDWLLFIPMELVDFLFNPYRTNVENRVSS